MSSDLAAIRLLALRSCEVCDASGHVFDEDAGGGRPCGACEGDGWQSEHFEATDLVDAVLVRMPQAVVPRGELEELVDSVKRSISIAASKSQGLSDADESGSWLRVVQEGAEALRSVQELLAERGR